MRQWEPMQQRDTRRQPESLIDLSSPRRCHVVGVGGPGMSAIALLLQQQGHIVSGSDIHDSDVISQLRTAGVAVHIGHEAHLVHGVDVVVYSTAIPVSNIELVEAEKLAIPVRHRSGILSSLCATTHAVGIAGTHGKTTTTALIAHIMRTVGLSPSSLVGAEVVGTGIGARSGDDDFFIIEADESDGSLDVLALTSLVVTNVDVDHLDYFETFEAIQNCFAEAALRASGCVVLNADDAGSELVRQAVTKKTGIVTFGTSASSTVQLVQENATVDGSQCTLAFNGKTVEVVTTLRGHHNMMNIAAAVALCVSLGIDLQAACEAVGSFSGVARRFTERGSIRGALLIDDYAHLPAEIEATISAVRSHPDLKGKLIAVFQPNRFHRIATMADTYADCFGAADCVVITDVYASGTAYIEGVTGELVVNAIRSAHPTAEVVWAPSRPDTVNAVKALLAPGDICVSMGCGDIEHFPDELIAEIGS